MTVRTVTRGLVPFGSTAGPARPRRGVRAALLCCVLAAAALPLTAGVAHAADGDTHSERLQGATRYHTAVAVAGRFAAEREAGIDAAVVVSGEDAHATCALAAAAVASQRTAPMLLTPSADLHPAAEDFLAGHGITDVVIVGGTDAVSARVADRLELLAGVAPVRLGGADCAEAALAVAQHVGAAPETAGRGRTALVATSASAADGLAAGPLAYRAGLPLLLTRGGELPAGAAGYLGEHVDHVIVLGGVAAVSESLEREIAAMGITTERWSGADRFATAARIADVLLGSDSPEPCFDGDGVGLASGFTTADGIASAPLLGERCYPLLLTETARLPRVTEAALRHPAVGGDSAGQIRLTVFGGSSAVAAGIERAAIAAGDKIDDGTGVPIGVTISVLEGACHWTVTFSEPVLTEDAVQIENYLLDREPLTAYLAEVHAGYETSTTEAVILLAGSHPFDGPVSAPTGCETPVAVRDRLGVVSRSIRSADRTTVNSGAELTVHADTTGPRLTLIAPAKGDIVWVRSSEPLAARTATFTLTRGLARKTQTVTVNDGDMTFWFRFPFPAYDSYAPADLPFTEPPWLAVGDRITIASGQLYDRAGNRNLAATHTVTADTEPPSWAY